MSSTSTSEIPAYCVKDMALAQQGVHDMDYAAQGMGALNMIKARFAKELPFKGIRIGIALHVTKETANLVRTLIAGGAEVALSGCNPLSTSDAVAAGLASEGVKVYAYKNESNADYYKYLKYVIDFKPHITIDDGCDLVSEIHQKYPDMMPDILGGCEETTTGIIRLKSMCKDNALKYPVIAVNNNRTKSLIDNFYGTGQSTIDGIIRGSGTFIAAKHFVVAGYGPCGKGIAKRASGLGAKVVVCEVDNFAALQAAYDGYTVMKMEDAAKIGDIFCTVTGTKDVITLAHMKTMKNGAIISNSGHFDAEIGIGAARAECKRLGNEVVSIRQWMEKFVFEDNFVHILAGGRLGCAEGHPSEVMSTSFCGQSLACEYLVKNAKTMERNNNIVELPLSVDDHIAGLQLKAMSISIDELTPEQTEYNNAWKVGT